MISRPCSAGPRFRLAYFFCTADACTFLLPSASSAQKASRALPGPHVTRTGAEDPTPSMLRAAALRADDGIRPRLLVHAEVREVQTLRLRLSFLSPHAGHGGCAARHFQPMTKTAASLRFTFNP